ncbi:hypothetical protein B0H67DRAFT_571872 [Lasiosphaeris hirsuta]|uniref:Secreted protein n=1 Tax=Lasiosphaeris hirsuta TaxID=260670 RepID=A0AA40E833_9PEZI|nr:hypothetical protein B0H67DRAFT_571872 [Lasiosphaeris hirsuta]
MPASHVLPVGAEMLLVLLSVVSMEECSRFPSLATWPRIGARLMLGSRMRDIVSWRCVQVVWCSRGDRRDRHALTSY